MRHGVCLLGAVAFVVGGCGDDGERTGSARSWLLEADAKGGLVDVTHPGFAAYPNPRLVDRLEVALQNDGRLCADDGERTWCGGPLQGIPYRVKAQKDGSRICARVVDIYGNDIGVRDCSLDLGAEADEAPVSATCEDGGDAKLVGAQLFTDVFNAYLEKVGLGFALAPPTSIGQGDGGEFEVGDAACAEVVDDLDDEFSDDVGDDEDDVFGEQAMAECLQEGECRIGQLVTRAMAEACGAIPAGCDAGAVSTGIVARGGETVERLCDEDDDGGGDEPNDEAPPPEDAQIPLMGDKPPFECQGSPLVLDLAGDGISLRGPDRAAPFSLMGTGPVVSGWLAGSDDALLALDVDGDGRITTGRELFGEATHGWARNGFSALARFDDNRDGRIDADDAVFARLVAWIDDGDAVAEPGETRPLTEVGVDALPVSARPLDSRDVHGNRFGLGADASRAGGGTMPLVDVWFRMGGAR